MKHIHFKEIDSTNSYLKKHYKELEHMTVVSADYQTKGRGQRDHVWYGDEDSLMFSILLKEGINDMDIKEMPFLAAKWLKDALSEHSQDITIKHPNDLMIHGKKVAGILVESIIMGDEVLAIVIGFGINVNQKKFPPELEGIATSLYIDTKANININNMFNKTITTVFGLMCTKY
jgi:biotin-[acetyl-CoA-carboxylase] ligase BirA-like protein